MIRIRGNRITMKKGDTGIFSIPNIYMRDGETVAVLTIYDMLYREKVIEKITEANDAMITFAFDSKDTQSLEPRTYYWDITVYNKPEYNEDGFPIDAARVDSYYGTQFKLPKFILKGGI